MAKLTRVDIAYTDTCLPDYFGGDSRPHVTIYPTKQGYTSSELREAILSEFRQGAIGGHDPVCCDFIQDENEQQNADKLFGRLLPGCLNREIKYRGKRLSYRELDIKTNGTIRG